MDAGELEHGPSSALFATDAGAQGVVHLKRSSSARTDAGGNPPVAAPDAGELGDGGRAATVDGGAALPPSTTTDAGELERDAGDVGDAGDASRIDTAQPDAGAGDSGAQLERDAGSPPPAKHWCLVGQGSFGCTDQPCGINFVCSTKYACPGAGAPICTDTPCGCQ